MQQRPLNEVLDWTGMQLILNSGDISPGMYSLSVPDRHVHIRIQTYIHGRYIYSDSPWSLTITSLPHTA